MHGIAGNTEDCFFRETSGLFSQRLLTKQKHKWVPNDTNAYDGQELNVAAKQAITDRFSVAVKVGAGYRDGKGGAANTTATDSRLFMTYQL